MVRDSTDALTAFHICCTVFSSGIDPESESDISRI